MTNLVIVGFILLMMYWWGSEGFFSSLMHLAAVVIAGSLALAIWEPIVHAFLLNQLPNIAMGLGLGGTFLILLFVVRFLFDRLVPDNVYFSETANWLGGGLCGLFSAILTAGLCVIAVGMLPGSVDLGGYEPFVIDARGQAVKRPGGDLWVAVDRVATNFYGRLSRAAFSTDTPLYLYRPQLNDEASLSRLRLDLFASNSAAPGDVEVQSVGSVDVQTHPFEDAVVTAAGDNARVTGYKVVTVDTKWTRTPGTRATFDIDATLRVYPAQVRLVTVGNTPETQNDIQLHGPFGVGRFAVYLRHREFIPFASDRAAIYADSRGMALGFGFLVPEDRKPLFLLVRNLRFDLTDESLAVGNPVAVLGSTAGAIAASQPKTPTPEVEQHGPVASFAALNLELTAKLPMDYSKNGIGGGFELSGESIIQGRGEAQRPVGTVSQAVRVNQLGIPKQQACIRLLLLREKAQSLLGAALAQAASLGGISMTDADGYEYLPVAFAWVREDSVTEIRYTPDEPIRSARELPISRMAAKDTMLLYFTVPKGVRMKTLKIGVHTDNIDMPVPQ